MTTRIQLYNAALRLCGDRKLSALTEDREARYLLDGVWDDGGVQACLEKSFWQFATRTVQVDYDTDITPSFGYNRAFSKPSDWIKTAGICQDEYFTTPLLQYSDENGYWYASIDTIYVKFISNGNSYGNDLSIWPQAFADFVAAHFARKIIKKLSGDENKETGLEKLEQKLLTDAKNLDASASPQKFPAPGNWATSRNTRNYRDRGNRGSLIG